MHTTKEFGLLALQAQKQLGSISKKAGQVCHLCMGVGRVPDMLLAKYSKTLTLILVV